MKIRVAKKVGKTYPPRHRTCTLTRAFMRFWKQDVRANGIPGNYDCFMAMVYGYPSFGWRTGPIDSAPTLRGC